MMTAFGEPTEDIDSRSTSEDGVEERCGSSSWAGTWADLCGVDRGELPPTGPSGAIQFAVTKFLATGSHVP
jgi:hypothetical protein